MKAFLACLAVLAASIFAQADIAPESFTGTNVFPVQSAEVRMRKADVHIVWGDPCTLTAEFTMVNDSGKEVEVETGFPVGAYHADRWDEDHEPSFTLLEAVEPSLIAITVNGAATTAYRRLPAEKIKELGWRYAAWYFAKIVFRPGENTVSVRTRLMPSGLSGQPYKRRLSYCISTGGRWQGPIGRETVTIDFPGVELSSLEIQPTPQNGRVAGSAIRWEFDDIEPRGAEYDIDLEFLLPAVATKLAALKSDFQRQPEDSEAALRYAVHLFCLGTAKGNSGFPPEKLSSPDYQSVLAQITDPARKEIFVRFYRAQGDHYASENTEWTQDRGSMIQILADAGFSQHYAEETRVAEARAIVEGCLARDPRNADAWNVYLVHFWRFSFAARGHWFGPSVYSAPLAKAIKAAYQNCPEDTRIAAWHDALAKNGPAPSLPESFRIVPECFRNEFSTAF